MGERENSYRAENLKHGGSRGYYRSKSELIIANMLRFHNITFKYEPKLILGHHRLYPDFAIRRSDSKIIFWEHCGMIADQAYSKKLFQKILFYAENDITLWDNLILSFDSADGHIDTSVIEKLIDLYCK